ncbi:SDR family oxidoreductase [Rubricoccus marinus]|uniref:LPS biosynthesis protein WbpP n=1 Tax=Rubricoccus marinus TaxID=716817 RepID=A0A259U0S3_9BACT|nr:SDR family oxidoreductase [Rubricoccus marinus]OZC03438.1 LPS biosynthesis protein WbpP [Rubricoccus marinus]
MLADTLRDPRTWCVTGAAGFIGSHLVETLLEHGQRVVALDNFSTGHRRNLDDVRRSVGPDAWESFRLVEGDIRELEVCKRAVSGVDAVLHQAALGSVPRSIADPLATHQVNVDGFVNMLLATRDAGIGRFVYASSSSVYGDHPGLPKVEGKIGTPLSPYAVSKRTNELYARTFEDHYDLTCVGLRYFNVFGPRQDPNGAYAAVIPKWVGQLLSGDRPHVHGDGETSRDFCYVRNVVQANIKAAVTPEVCGVFNVAYQARTTLLDLYRYIVSGLEAYVGGELPSEPTFGPFREGDVQHSLADTSRAQAILDYSPSHSVREGLEETLAWYASAHKGAVEDAIA